MNHPQKKVNYSLIITSIISGVLAYSFAVRYTEFFLRSNVDKAILLAEIWIVIYLLSLVLITPFVKRLLIGIDKGLFLKLLFVSALLSALVTSFFVDLPPFPKKLELAIQPVQVHAEKTNSIVTLVSITRIDPPRNIPEPVRLVNLGFEHGWVEKNNSLVSSADIENTAPILYDSYVQGVVKVLFLTGPEQGDVEVIVNGESEIFHLQESAPGTIEKTITIANSWKNADMVRKIMLIGVVAADAISILVLILFFVMATYQVVFKRMLKMRGVVSLLMVIILSIGMGVLSNQQQREIAFSDPELDSVVRSEIDKPDGRIYSHDVLTIIELNLSGRNVTDLSGIEFLRNLRVLDVGYNTITDLSPLGKLTKLQRLDLSGNHIVDLSQFPILPKLEQLTLRQNDIQDIRVLQKLVGLKTLDLGQNMVTDLNPLRNLKNLQKLDLRQNMVTDLTPLAELTHLKYLNLHSNIEITDISPLRKLTSLESLVLRNIPIGDQVSELIQLVHLQHLNLRNTGMRNTEPLVALLSTGALQDDENTGVRARLNILDNKFDTPEHDPYKNLRFYWHNITYRYPYSLPNVSTDTNPPTFSHAGGFYEEGFQLELLAKESGEVIYYTIDGSEPSISPQYRPTGSTLQYNSPIPIQSKVNAPNIYSNIQTSRIKNYTTSNDVFKATIVRAIVLDKNGQVSSISTNAYFVGEEIATRYTLPILSISTQPEGLFSDEMGIYVPGDLYEYLYSDDRLNPANYTQRGEKWERSGNMQMYDASGTLLLDQQIGIRLHGGASRAYSQKSLRISVEDNDGTTPYISFDFFPDLNHRFSEQPVTSFESLILRTGGGGDWDNSMVRDVIGQSLLESTGLDIQGNYPVVVFINGEYWGIQNLRMRYDAHYFQSHYGISAEDLVVCERGLASLFYGEPGDEEEYQEFLRLIDPDSRAHGYTTVNILAEPQKFNEISAEMDIDNYIEYTISQIYVHKTDWPLGNILFWKTKNPSLEKDSSIEYGHDGKWRWMVIDMDLGLYNPQGDSLARATKEGLRETFLFRALLQNQMFRTTFITRFADRLNTIFKEEVVLQKISKVEDQYAPEIADHIQRWGTFGGSVNSWHETIDEIRLFARLRPKVQRQQIVDYFGLAGTAQVTISTDPSKGFVRVNTIDITETTAGVEDPSDWTGIYFQGVPVTITAVPAEGYRFSHWEGLDSGMGGKVSLEITLTSDLELTAIFTK